MQLSEFDYNLPKELIAQTPLKKRDNSKLLIVDKKNGQLSDNKFSNLLDMLWKQDVLVINKTRVINARLKWYIKINNSTSNSVIPAKAKIYNWKNTINDPETSSGWQLKEAVWQKEQEWDLNNFGWLKEVEIFLHKQISDNIWDCLVYPWKKLKVWTQVFFENNIKESETSSEWQKRKQKLQATIKSISEYWRIVEFNKWWIEFLKEIEMIWEVPLPPYIKEKLKNFDRYQTVYNEKSWSVAAPTAGLHFTTDLLKQLEKKWVKIEKVLLHVWLWTFKNVETSNIKDHKMHKEYIELKKEVAERLNKYKNEWKNIIAVWTTSVRVLESFSDNTWILKYWKKETDIFIYPGYKWKFVNNLITNFHLPKSTLLMLVSSLAWKENIKKAYNYAIKHKYRFFSFWDAMMIK